MVASGSTPDGAGVIGEVRIVDDVPAAFADLVADAVTAATAPTPFILGASGGSSGAACFGALAQRDLTWSRIEMLFVDERCVPWDSPDANGHAIASALGDRLGVLRAYHRMSCDEGPEAYEALLGKLGRIDLVQLGLGPDGHTASIFPDSDEFRSPSRTLVARATDPTGRNRFPRLTLTAKGLALAVRTVVTVSGGDKAEAFRALGDGAPLPGALVDGPETIWLVDREAAAA
jgi:6-phosphogluconolactonase/glucosamine-6-phosphate isomerase/deaminase